MGRIALSPAIGLLLALIACPVSADVYTYSIGNSLTMDSYVQGMAELAGDRGVVVQADRHIRGGAGLGAIWNEPTVIHEPALFAGPFPTAFAGYTWDKVTLQPFYQDIQGSGGALETTLNFMNYAKSQNPANVDAQFYILAKWPQQNEFIPGYTEIWNTPYSGPGGNTGGADYFEQLLAQIHANQPSDMKPVKLIPTGHVMAEIDRLIRLGQIPGLTNISQLYRDDIHLSALGSFVATTTLYASLFNDDPTGLAPPAGYPAMDPALVSQLQGIVWDTVQSVPEPAVACCLVTVLWLGRSRRPARCA